VLWNREVRGKRGAREGLEDDALPRRVHVAVQQRKAASAEELLHVRRHGAFTHHDAAVDEAPGGLGTGDDNALPPQNVRAEDAAVRGQALLDEAERVLRKDEGFAEQRKSVAARGKRWRGHWHILLYTLRERLCPSAISPATILPNGPLNASIKLRTRNRRGLSTQGAESSEVGFIWLRKNW